MSRSDVGSEFIVEHRGATLRSRAVTNTVRWLVLPMVASLALAACSSESPDAGPGRVTDPSKEPTDDPSDDDDDDESATPTGGFDAGKPIAKDAGGSPVKKDAGGGASGEAGAVPGKDSGSTDSGSAVEADAAALPNEAGVVQTADASTDAGTAPGGGGPATDLGKCEALATKPCSTFVTKAGTEIPLGPYGAAMDTNVGKGFENTVNRSDTTAGCTAFASLFGQDEASTAELVELNGADLKLYTVYRPARWVEGEKYPIVSWGNGTCAKPEGYGALLRYVASQGFVVFAPNSRYVGSGNEQKRAIDFALAANSDATSPYYQKLDPTKVAAMGHSQGSQGTAAAASDARIKTVILFNGGTSASKPFFGVSGDRDIGSPTASTYRTAVNRATKGAFIFFHKIPGTGNADGHLTLMTQPERVIEPTARWLKLLLNDDADSKEWFVGTSCKLCGSAADYEFGQKGL